jgi:PKD repeat protein
MRFVSVAGRRAGFLGAIVAMLTAFAALAPSAAAQLVSGGHGRVIGMTLRAGVDRAAIRGVVAGPAASRGAVGGPAVTRAAADPGTLAYGGGQVLHSTKPYLVFWDPTASISATTRSIITSYFTDAAVDSGRATNVYSVARQFTDTTGFADYKQAFSPASQVIDDTGNYPLPDQANCKDTATRYPYCLTDAQIQTELARVISADGLPTGSGPNAPVYFVMTADNTDVCTSATSCADNVFCAYHSSLTDGSANVLYSVDPLFFDGTAQSPQNPKICQADNNAAVQAPNADVLADVGLSSISREFNDTITDPFRTGWHSSSGQEDGDQCAFYSPASDPVNDGNPDAFLPTLGGDATAGTLYDQAINGEHYYTQSEWSNQGLACRMTPTPSPLTAAFAQPPASATGTPVSFDPTASSAAAGFSSATWSWGDGTADTFQDFRSGGTPATQTHTFTAKGAYTVTLTLIDTYGNEQQVSHTVDIGLPHAAFDSSPSNPGAASPVSFDASASSDTGAPITSYSWDFGDGLSGTGKTTSHVFAKAGTYTVNLTVGDGTNTDTVSHTVTVAGVPQAAFSSLPSTPGVGAPVSFDGSSSTDSGGTLSSYSWNFGDGGTASGETASHTYAAGGAYTVTLTVGDGTSTNSISHVVSVRGAPSASFTASTATSPAAAVIQFNGSSSSEPGGSISSYAWSFGDGANGTARPRATPTPRRAPIPSRSSSPTGLVPRRARAGRSRSAASRRQRWQRSRPRSIRSRGCRSGSMGPGPRTRARRSRPTAGTSGTAAGDPGPRRATRSRRPDRSWSP